MGCGALAWIPEFRQSSAAAASHLYSLLCCCVKIHCVSARVWCVHMPADVCTRRPGEGSVSSITPPAPQGLVLLPLFPQNWDYRCEQLPSLWHGCWAETGSEFSLASCSELRIALRGTHGWEAQRMPLKYHINHSTTHLSGEQITIQENKANRNKPYPRPSIPFKIYLLLLWCTCWCVPVCRLKDNLESQFFLPWWVQGIKLRSGSHLGMSVP